MRSKRKGITPFWNRLPHFFLFPLRPPAVFISLGYAILGASLYEASLFLVLLRLVVFFMLIKYAYEALNATAQGHLQPPPFNRDVIVDGYELPFKQWAVFLFLLILSNSLAKTFGVGAVMILGLLFWLLLPANVMVLATTRSLIASLNPVLLFGLIKRLGWAYLGLYGLLLCLFFAWQNLSIWLYSPSDSILPIFLAYWVDAYYLLAMFHLMGYILYQYHERLGLDADVEDEDEGTGLGLFDTFMEREDYPAAAEELKYIVRRSPTDTALRLKLHRVLKLAKDDKDLRLHGREFITFLLNSQQTQATIVEVLVDCLQVDRGFKPAHEHEYRPLMDMLRLTGESANAVYLADSFHKRFPDSAEIPSLYLLVAQILSDDLKQKAPAKKVLNFLSQQFPDHPIMPQVQAYQNLLGATP